MKTHKLFYLLLAISFVQFAFTYEEKEIIGVWVYHEYTDENSVFVKEKKFDDNKPGIEFKSNGTLSKRQNIGWCGTPPVSYGNYDGTWKKTSDSTLTMRYKYWGGEAEQDLQIISCDTKRLVVKFQDTRYFESK